MSEALNCNLKLQTCRKSRRAWFVIAVVLATMTTLVASATAKIRRIESRLATEERETCAKQLYVIEDMLPLESFETVIQSAKQAPFVRKNMPMRNGEAVSSATLRARPDLRVILDATRDARFLQRIHRETGMHLQLTPRTDENGISVLRYSAPGDGIDEHYDGNVYIGSRWVGILILSDDGDSQLIVDGTLIPTQRPNTLLLFQGDVSKHAVTRRSSRGERVVLNILLCDVCALRTDLLSKVWSSIVSNGAFY